MNPLDSLNDKKTFYIAGDGDDIGRHHGQAILSNNPEEVKEVSQKIGSGQEALIDWVSKWGGEMISSGGDEFIASIPEEALDEIDAIRKDYEYVTGFTISFGIGNSMSEAGKALLVAKVKGKNQSVFYSPEIETEVQNISQHYESGQGTEEENKLSQAYLNQDGNERNTSHEVENSPPQHEDNNKGYDSGYKDDNIEDRNESYEKEDLVPPIVKKPNLKGQPIIGEAVNTDVAESDRLMNEIEPSPEEKRPEIEKPAPKDYPGEVEQDEMEDEEKRNAYSKPGDLKYGDGKDNGKVSQFRQEMANPDFSEEKEPDMENLDALPPEESKDRSDLEEDPTPVDFLDQHIENAKDYQDSLDAPQMEGGATLPSEVGEENAQEGEPEPDSVEELLDAHIENAQEMMDEQGISRPADYNQKDDDMGLSEEEAEDGQPDISEVLKEGLDSHADNIQREKIVNMVGEALDGFKSQKKILDKAREQAPELYASCIKMLQSMIELCSLAGIDQSQAQQDMAEIEGQGEACPNCGHPTTPEKPEVQAAPKEETAQAPQQKPVGKPTGVSMGSAKQLSAKNPTPHVVKETTPVGGLNSKGQKRYIDPTTGKDSYISMLTPRVLGPRGIPVKG